MLTNNVAVLSFFVGALGSTSKFLLFICFEHYLNYLYGDELSGYMGVHQSLLVPLMLLSAMHINNQFYSKIICISYNEINSQTVS